MWVSCDRAGGGKADTANGSIPVEGAAPEQFLAQVLAWAEEYAASTLAK